MSQGKFLRMLGESAASLRTAGSSDDAPNSGVVSSLTIEAALSDEGLSVHHCLVANSYLVSGLTHRASSPLGALLTNLSMLQEDLATLMGKLKARELGAAGAGEAGSGDSPVGLALGRALEDVAGALEIAERLRADLTVAKSFAVVPYSGETSNFYALLGQWAKTTASAALGSGAVKMLESEQQVSAALEIPESAWLVSGSSAALNHLLTTALLLISSSAGSVRGESQVSILPLLSGDRIEVTLSTSCNDASLMTSDWSEKARALGGPALAVVGSDVSLELTLLEGVLAAKLGFGRGIMQSEREGSWA